MVKYSTDFKLQIVKEYIDGKGSSGYLAIKYKIKDHSQIRRWVQTYKEFGAEGLERKQYNKKYSIQFKLKAIELYETTDMSYREVAHMLGINNPSLIGSWVIQFRKEGVHGLSKPKGRPISKEVKSPKKLKMMDETNLSLMVS